MPETAPRVGCSVAAQFARERDRVVDVTPL